MFFPNVPLNRIAFYMLSLLDIMPICALYLYILKEIYLIAPVIIVILILKFSLFMVTFKIVTKVYVIMTFISLFLSTSLWGGIAIYVMVMVFLAGGYNYILGCAIILMSPMYMFLKAFMYITLYFMWRIVRSGNSVTVRVLEGGLSAKLDDWAAYLPL